MDAQGVEELMNEPLFDTPHGQKMKQQQGPLYKGHKGQNPSHRELTYEDDNKLPPTVEPIAEGEVVQPMDPDDAKEVVRNTRSSVQEELAALGQGRQLITKVKNLQPGKAPTSTTSDLEKTDGKDQGGGVLEFFGLAGGRRRRRRKKSRKNKRKSKRTKRMARKSRRRSRRKRRSRRGGFGACPAEKCPCPRWGGKDRGMCVRERANGRGRWFNYKYGKGKKYAERQAYVNASDELKAKRAAFVAEGKAIASRQAEERKRDEEGFSALAGENSLAGNTALLAQSIGVRRLPGAGKRGRRRKSRKKRKKSRRKRKRSRRRRRRRK